MPDPAPDYYNRLLEQRRAEYAAKGLSKMPPDFLSATTRYLTSLRDVLEREARENPTSKKVEMTRATYQRALASARDVLEARLTKIAHQAAQYVNLGSEPANLLPEERALYDAIVREIGGFRRTSAPFLEAGPGASAPSLSRPAPAGAAPTAPLVPSPSPSTALSAPPAPAPAPSAAAPSPPGPAPPVVVRVLQDRPALALPQETLEVRKEDLLTLPADKAQLLVQAGIAQKIESRPPATTT